MVNRENLINETKNYTSSFNKFKTKRYFAKNIYNGKSILNDANEDQSNSLVEIMNFKKQIRPRDPEKKQGEKILLKAYMHFMKVEKWFLMVLKINYIH